MIGTARHLHCTVYPRVCGGTFCSDWGEVLAYGLSPRVRGNLYQYCSIDVMEGSIPACAGEPLLLSCIVVLLEVYPRVCGGTRCT